jgi:hypothetical protein
MEKLLVAHPWTVDHRSGDSRQRGVRTPFTVLLFQEELCDVSITSLLKLATVKARCLGLEPKCTRPWQSYLVRRVQRDFGVLVHTR